MVQSKKQRYLFLAFCLIPTFIMFAIFTLYPLFSGLYYSFFDWSGSSHVKTFIGVDNYIKLFNDSIIPKTILHDYFLVVTKVIGIMVLAIFFAVALTQLKIKEAPFYRIVFFFPNIMSVVVAYTVMILYIYIHNGGLHTLGIFFFLLFLSTAHFITPVFLISFLTGMVGLVFTYQFPEAAQATVVQSNFLSFLVAYILSGMVSLIVIRLNKNQFARIEELLDESDFLPINPVIVFSFISKDRLLSTDVE